LASGQSFLFSKASIANTGANSQWSLWRATGIPVQPAAPTATVVTVVTAITDTTGSINYGMQVATGQTAYIAKLAIVGSVTNALFVADRLVHNGGLAHNTTALNTFNTFTLPSDRGLDLTNYTDVHWFLEIYTDIGVTANTCTVTYDSPTSSTQTVAISLGGASPLNRAGKLIEIPPNAGHPIVDIKSTRMTTASAVAGSYGITALKEHGMYPMGTVNVGVLYDFAQAGLHDIPTTASIMFYVMCTTTSTGIVSGMMRVVKG
jgi:hypothetical protein